MQTHPIKKHRPKWLLPFIGVAGLTLSFALGRATAQNPERKPSILSTLSVLSKNPLGKEPFKIIPLLQGQDASATLVRAMGQLKPHYHEGREEIVYVIRGGGTMILGGRKRPVKAGDVIYIPRGTVHGFTNGAKSDTVVFSVMAPPFDGKDRHFLEEGKKP
jgi:mannose-6-phosphate isomerase-like protein (cupin superfamily)